MALPVDNALYYPINYLQTYFVDKQTGLPLAGGKVYFWHDNNRNSLKDVYQLTSGPNYSFTPLANPLTLSNAGTFVDNDGNDIAVYLKPYDATGLIADNYYIQAFAAGEAPPPFGTPMFTREAVPGVVNSAGPDAAVSEGFENAVSNSQFSQVLFDPTIGMTIPYIAGVTTKEIAPGWTLKITAVNSGSLTVSRTALNGNAAITSNPPYSLTVAPGGSITDLILYQRLFHNPGIFSGAYISGAFVAGPATQTISLKYIDSNANSTTIVSGAGAAADWAFHTATIALGASGNPQSADVGYVDLVLQLNTAAASTFSSIQVLGLATNILNIAYNEESVNDQANGLFYWHQPTINYKQSDSYLVGWDFPLNPAQFGVTYTPLATGANQGLYCWDQTIVFTTTASGTNISRSANGGLSVVAAQDGQVALIQYLDLPTALKIINDRASVRMSLSGSIAGGATGSVTLWATATDPLPVLPSTLVTGLTAAGAPSGTVAGWVQIPNVNQTTTFTVPAISATNAESNDIVLSGWDLAGEVPSLTAKYFAIVVGFSEWAIADSLLINSISLCGGDIPSRPAPKTADAVEKECYRYYWKTFPTATLPAQNAGVDGVMTWSSQASPTGAVLNAEIGVSMRITPTVTLYNPLANNAQARNLTTPGDASNTAAGTISTKRFTVNAVNATLTPGQRLSIHATADARLGVF
jgi:hypothetical protein